MSPSNRSHTSLSKLRFIPLTPARWRDAEKLFGPRGACGGCWCMWWRKPRSQWTRDKGAANRRDFKAVVNAGPPPGLLAYAGREPIAWCAVAPRQAYVGLTTSRTLKPIDDQPVWSITCFFVSKPWRRRGVSVQLLRAAADFVRKQGGRIVEGYPDVPRKTALPDAFAWRGLASAFLKAGFTQAARPSPTRAVMRKTV